jgi:hypothetical protein
MAGKAQKESRTMKKFTAAAAVIAALTIGALMTGSVAAKAQAFTLIQDSPAKASPLNGKWHFVLDTSGGDRELEAAFTVDADGKVTGTFGDSSGVTGTFKDGKLDLAFEFTSQEAGTTDTMKIMGKLDEAGALTGNWQFSQYDGSFTASRPKA